MNALDYIKAIDYLFEIADDLGYSHRNLNSESHQLYGISNFWEIPDHKLPSFIAHIRRKNSEKHRHE